jgi:hypothetical protein
MLLLDEGTHRHGLGLFFRLRQRRAAFCQVLFPDPTRGDADFRQERVAFRALLLDEDNFDPKQERFVHDFAGDANELSTRQYRPPFVVREVT